MRSMKRFITDLYNLYCHSFTIYDYILYIISFIHLRINTVPLYICGYYGLTINPQVKL